MKTIHNQKWNFWGVTDASVDLSGGGADAQEPPHRRAWRSGEPDNAISSLSKYQTVAN